MRQNTLLAPLLSLLLILASSSSSNSPDGEAELQASPGLTVRKDWEENARLPEHLIPLHYQLYLHPDLQEGTFTGLI